MNNAKEYPDEECNCPLMDRQILNAGAGSWTTSMDWYCPIHGQQHRDYEKPKGWGGDWTPQQQHEWSQSIKHAMNKQNERSRSPYEPSKRERETLRANLKGAQEGFDSVFSAEAPATKKLPNPEDDGPHAAGNQIPATDVSWELEFEDMLSTRWQDGGVWLENTGMVAWENVKEFIRKQIDRTREESKHITKSGRVMYIGGKREAFGEVLNILNDELATAHTTTSGKTSRLTSAINRVYAALEALSNR